MTEVTEQEKRQLTEDEKRKLGSLKQLVFDTETTGLYVDKGDRLVEIAAIEVIGGVPTGKKFHTFINPERDVPPEAYNVHKISTEFLKDKPLFAEVAQDFLDFVKGYEVVAHNAKFDVGFLDTQLTELGLPAFSSVVKSVTCTLEVSKANYPEVKGHSLDAICKRQGIDLAEREAKGHNAVLDCELLSEVYMNMILEKGWDNIRFDPEMKDFEAPAILRFDGIDLPEVTLNENEVANHQEIVGTIGNALFAKPEPKRLSPR